MNIVSVEINNFRGIKKGKVYFNNHTVLIGDNNAGKSTILEAIDLVLGPERLNRTPIVDEHDFYNGQYYVQDNESPKIEIEVMVTDLEDDQKRKFKNNLQFLNTKTIEILQEDSIDEVDDEEIKEVLRLKFEGYYDKDDDDFKGDTYFCWPEKENPEDELSKFRKLDKRECGFLYLRALRTGARALSMERGSLLDIILRLKEIRPKMWEDVLEQLRSTTVAEDPDLGIKGILESIQEALKEFVPTDWGSEPILKVSDLTRESLRKTLTIFMSTGDGSYHAPFQHQGTGTINTMVLALLTIIAEEKKNVIFAMEEPEIAIPPYTQKRIVDSIKKRATQAIFTSHSPFVLEEFDPSRIVLVQRNEGDLNSQSLVFPKAIRPKNYNHEFRTRFAEALLAKRILLTEGTTEAVAYNAAARKCNELMPAKYKSLEAMGISVFNVASDSAIATFGKYFTELGKEVFAVFDKQEISALEEIEKNVKYPFESPYHGIENMILEEMDEEILTSYCIDLIDNDNWPSHLSKLIPGDFDDFDQIKKALRGYLKWSKGANSTSDLIENCTSTRQIPKTIKNTLKEITEILS